MEDEQLNYIKELQNNAHEERARRINAEQNAVTMFNSEANENLVKWQLDIKEELERIEHLLRKHVPKRDGKGNEYFVEPEDKFKLFNEHGVQEILNLLAWYLNKNIILSDFEDEEINLRVFQFSQELADFIFNNYEDFGLDNENKIKHYPIVHMNIVNTVEAAYHRALGGKERDSLRSARMVSQSENLNEQGSLPSFSKNKFSLLKPSTW